MRNLDWGQRGWGMMGPGMMGNWGYPGFFSWYCLLIQILLLVNLILLAVYLWKKINEHSKK